MSYTTQSKIAAATRKGSIVGAAEATWQKLLAS